MKGVYIITFSCLCTFAFAQWPNAVDKRLPIVQSSSYYQISDTRYDKQGNVYVAIKAGRFVTRPVPNDNSYVPVYFQKLDKNGFEQWNIDSTQIVCDRYISVPEKDGGMYVFYAKYHNIKNTDPVYNNVLGCTYIDKRGLKRWNTELENFNVFGGVVFPLSARINAEGNIELYFKKSQAVYFQTLDKIGNRLLHENKKISGELAYANVYVNNGEFVYSRQETNVNSNRLILSRRDKDWNDLWKKEAAIENNEAVDVFFDKADNIIVLGRSGQQSLHVSAINSTGDILFSRKEVADLTNFSVSDHQHYFDSQNNLHLYLQLSSLINSNIRIKIQYIKLNEQGEIVVSKELENISNRITESYDNYPYGAHIEKNYDFSINNQGNVLLSWVRKENNQDELYHSKFDSEGNLLWNEDKLIEKDSTIISVVNISSSDSANIVFYSTGRFPYGSYPPIHSSNFYIKRLSKNGNFNELSINMPDHLCENDKLNLSLQTEGTFEDNNLFRVLLSDAGGGFSNAREIATGKQTAFTIADLAETAGAYQIKVVSTNPIIEVSKPVGLKILKTPAMTLQYQAEVVKYDSTLVRLYLTGTPPYRLKLWDDKEIQVSDITYQKYIKPAGTDEYSIKAFSDANCMAKPLSFKITVLEPLSTERQVSDKVKVYPVPATGTLTVEVNNEVVKNADIVVYTLKGEPVYKKQSNDGIIDLKELSQGVYLLNGNINGKSFSRKIIVAK